MSLLSLALLGPVHVALDGRPLRFRTNKVQALLIYLAIEATARPAARHRREALMELLWPGLPLLSAQDNLRQILYQLRKAIPSLSPGDSATDLPLLLADRQTVQLNPAGTYVLDVATFQDLLRGSPPLTKLEQAVALYRGDFLSDFYLPDSDAFEAWTANYRAVLRRQALDALDRLVDECTEQRELGKAETYAHQQLNIDNLRERAHRQLITVLAQSGQRSQALRHYEALTVLLEKELGLSPEEETTALYTSLSAQRPSVPSVAHQGEKHATTAELELTGAGAREERRWVTVLFANVVETGARSGRVDPEDAKDLADRWSRRLCQELRRFGGTVVSVVADQVVGVFGAPTGHGDDAERAVRAGLAMAALHDDRAPKAGCVRVAINTGEAMAGLIGPIEQRTYTVIGDTINDAARLLPAIPLGSVWVGGSTYRLTRHIVQYHALPPGMLQARNPPAPTWEALSMTEPPHTRSFGTAPLIGRDQELDRLLAMWQQVLDAMQPHLVTILGEAGIGKSRLVAEFEQRLPGFTTVLRGSCLPYGTALSYGVLETIVREAAEITAEADAVTARAKLEELVARVMERQEQARDVQEIARHLALMIGLDLETDRLAGLRDERAFRVSAHRFLIAFARHRPLCLVFDNLQWADAALLDLIEYVATHAHDVPLLIVVQARPELIEQRVAWGGRVKSSTLMWLQPLDVEAEQTLVRALRRERGLPDQSTGHIHSGIGGNPLYVEELVAMVAEQGEDAGVPLAIKLLISARLDTLQADERQMLQVAAVFGSTFWEGGVCSLVGRDITAQLEALAQKGLLRFQPRSHYPGEYEYAFKHDLIRDVAYDMLPRAERRALHGQAADWLEQTAGSSIEAYADLIAHHAIEADQHRRALTYMIRAAEQAGRSTAHRQAAALLAEAITLAKSLGEHALVAELRARRGRAFVDLGLWTAARDELEAALTLLGAAEIERRVQVLSDLAWTKFWLVDVAGQRDAANQAMAIVEHVERADLRAKALFAVGFSHLNNAELQATYDLCRQALSQTGAPPIRERALAAWASGLVSLWRGNYDEAIDNHRQAVQMGYDQHDTVPTTTALPQLGLALAGSGRYDEAKGVFDRALQYGREHEHWPFLARAMSMAAGLHLDLYDYPGHEQIATEARDVSNSLHFAPPAVSAGIDLLLNFARRQELGRCEPLMPKLAEVVETAAGVHGWLWRIRIAEAHAEIALARGDWEGAMHWAEQGIARSRKFGRVKYHALSLESRARALVAVGRTHEAITDLQSAVSLARSIGDPALLLRVATTLLAIDGDDALLAETLGTVERISAALPNAELRKCFEAAEPVRLLVKLTGQSI